MCRKRRALIAGWAALAAAAAALASGACGEFAVDGAAGPPDAAASAESGDANADANADAGVGHLVVFITDLGYPEPASAEEADTKCRAEALGRLAGKFVAWFSTSTTPAPARLTTGTGALVDGPWYRPDGLRVAASRAALLNAAVVPLENAIEITATMQHNGGGVWTRTLADGGVGVLCPAAPPTTGAGGSKDKPWTDQTYFAARCDASLALYCFQVE